MTRLPITAFALLLTGCIQQVHRDKLQAASDTDNTSGDTGDDNTTGMPEPTTGGSIDEPTGNDITSESGAISLGDPPRIVDFFVDTSIHEAGPLWIDAEVADAVRTRLVIERDGEEVAAVDDPKLPWELPITSESTFDGSYTITLQAWASGGAHATASRDVTVDLPTGGTLAASWEDSGEWPSSVAALGVIRADNVAPSDGIIAALAVDGQNGPEMWLYRFDSDLVLKHPVQTWCGGDICRWTPTGLVVDANNHVLVVGNDDEFSWLMKFDANGQPLWNEAHKLHGGHASGVAVDEAYTYISGWADKSEDMWTWSDARIWVVQAGITVGVLDYSNVIENQPEPASSRAHAVTVTDEGRVLLAGETQVSDPDDAPIPRGTILEFTGFTLALQWQAPTWVDGWEQSSLHALAPKDVGVVAAGWYAPDANARHRHIASFNEQLAPDSVTSGDPGVNNAIAIHPENQLVTAGELGSSTIVSAPGMWGDSSASTPYARARGLAVDRYGRIYYAGEHLDGDELRARVGSIHP